MTAMTILFLEDDNTGAVCDFLAGRGCPGRPFMPAWPLPGRRWPGRCPTWCLDRNLPDGDGADLCRALRARCPGCRCCC